MSLRNLQRQCGVAPGETSTEAQSVLQPNRSGGRGRGGGSEGQGYYASGGGSGHASSSSRGGNVAYAGNATNVAYPAPSGGFHGSSAQAAHVEAMRRATAEAAKSKPDAESTAVAQRSGLGLAALKERQAKEEEERQAKRDAARAKRRNEATKKEVEDEQVIQECEAQATQDCIENARLKYEAALIVRIATKFGTSGVWMKIAEARARGANIPLDPRKVYLLAHPDKCPLEEASDATAILNAQRPPEMTEVKIAPKAARPPTPAETVAAPPPPVAAVQAVTTRAKATPAPSASSDPIAAPAASESSEVVGLEDCFVAASLQKFIPDAQAWCTDQGAASIEELSEELDSLVVDLGLKPLEKKRLEKALCAAISEKSTAAAMPAPKATTAAPSGVPTEEQRIDPEDGKLGTLKELVAKYTGVYSEKEVDEYWRDHCKPKPRSRKF